MMERMGRMKQDRDVVRHLGAHIPLALTRCLRLCQPIDVPPFATYVRPWGSRPMPAHSTLRERLRISLNDLGNAVYSRWVCVPLPVLLPLPHSPQ